MNCAIEYPCIAPRLRVFSTSMSRVPGKNAGWSCLLPIIGLGEIVHLDGGRCQTVRSGPGCEVRGAGCEVRGANGAVSYGSRLTRTSVTRWISRSSGAYATIV